MGQEMNRFLLPDSSKQKKSFSHLVCLSRTCVKVGVCVYVGGGGDGGLFTLSPLDLFVCRYLSTATPGHLIALQRERQKPRGFPKTQSPVPLGQEAITFPAWLYLVWGGKNLEGWRKWKRESELVGTVAFVRWKKSSRYFVC